MHPQGNNPAPLDRAGGFAGLLFCVLIGPWPKGSMWYGNGSRQGCYARTAESMYVLQWHFCLDPLGFGFSLLPEFGNGKPLCRTSCGPEICLLCGRHVRSEARSRSLEILQSTARLELGTFPPPPTRKCQDAPANEITIPDPDGPSTQTKVIYPKL